MLFGNERPQKMQNTEDQKKILKLASQVLDETIDRENFIKLEELLSVSSENRNFYLEVILLEALLHWEQEADEEEITFEKPKIIPFPLYTAALSAAAVFVALIAGWWAFSNFESGTTTTNTPIAVAHFISPELDELQSGNQIPSLASADLARPHLPSPAEKVLPIRDGKVRSRTVLFEIINIVLLYCSIVDDDDHNCEFYLKLNLSRIVR